MYPWRQSECLKAALGGLSDLLAAASALAIAFQLDTLDRTGIRISPYLLELLVCQPLSTRIRRELVHGLQH